MAKRKPDVVSDEEEDQEMSELVDVDFDFFDLQEDDFHAISNLIKQLLSHDAKDFDVSGLSDFVIQQKLGSTVKCDGESSAAYAFCSVINIAQTANAAVTQLSQYLLEKTRPKASKTFELLQQCLSDSDKASASPLGIVLNERLINMPPQITAPFLRLLQGEMEKAVKQDRPFAFQYLLFLSRVFVPEAEEAETAPVGKKKKKAAQVQKEDSGLFVYHAEDEVIIKFSEDTLDFSFSYAPERDQDSFGVDTRGRLMLVPMSRLEDLISQLEIEGEQ